MNGFAGFRLERRSPLLEQEGWLRIKKILRSDL